MIERLTVDGENAAGFLNADGKKLKESFDDIESQTGDSDILLPPADYAEFFLTAIASVPVRWPENPAARVRIYGLLEARLTDTDRVVLGGLAEGIWPPEVRGDH